MKHPFRYYFQKNIWLTTSGHFSTPDLVNAITAVGADRIMFSIDHPVRCVIDDGYGSAVS